MEKRMLSLLLVLMLLMTGCTKDSSSTKDESGENNATTEKSVTDVDEADMFSDRDLDATYDESKSVLIELNGNSASCDSDAVEISGTRVTITDEGTFILSGTLEDGMVIVNAGEKDKPQLVLNGVFVTSETSAPLYVLGADKVFVTLADGTENTLANGGAFTAIDDNNIDGAVFSKQDLTFNGTGSLTVTSPAGHGIVCKDDLVFTGGTYTIASADDSVQSNASIGVNGGTFHIASGDDGFHADETLLISAGTIEITESYEGLEALDIKVTGGDIKLVASDDGLNAAGGTDSSGTGGVRGGDQFGGPGGPGGHGGMGGGGMSSNSNGSIVISGGNLYINASGDGIDANGYIEITGGYTVVVGPTQGDTATLDYDTSATITGGTFIGTGASGMAQTFSDSEQGVVALSVGNSAAGTTIELKDKDGNTIISYAPELNFAVVILSSPEIEKGETYSITVGDATGEFEAS